MTGIYSFFYFMSLEKSLYKIVLDQNVKIEQKKMNLTLPFAHFAKNFSGDLIKNNKTSFIILTNIVQAKLQNSKKFTFSNAN